MNNKQIMFKALQRRFDEIFLLKFEDIVDNEDFNFFLNRIVDYYVYLNINFSEFLKSMDEYIKIVGKEISPSVREVTPLILKVKQTFINLYNNPSFIDIYNEGKNQFESVKGGGVHSVSTQESMYISLSSAEQVLLKFPEENQNILSLTDSFKNTLNVIYDLQILGKKHVIPDFINTEKDIKKAIVLCEKMNDKAKRIFDYSRLNSKLKIEQLYQYIHNDKDEHGILRMTLGSIKRGNYNQNNPSIQQTVKISYKEYKLYILRLHNSFLDWLEGKYFIEEAILNVKVWGEMINNKKLINILDKPTETRNKETLFHEEIRTFLFNTYLILAIREPNFITKRPDLLIENYKGKKILSEVKLFKDEGTKDALVKKIKEGLLQLQSYSLVIKNVESLVLIIFNGHESIAILNDIVEDTFLGKPLFILPINFNVKPSEIKNPITINTEDIKQVIQEI